MGELRRVNLYRAELEHDADDPDGYHAGYNRFGPQVGGSMLGATIYELPPGQSNCPYHYEYGNEEWLIVLAAGSFWVTNQGSGTVSRIRPSS